MSDIKRCPFCAGEAKIIKNCQDHRAVTCTKCGTLGRTRMTESEAVEWWNNRPLEQDELVRVVS